MRNYGNETHGLRREERALVASEYPSIVQYRRVLTPYEQQKAEAGKLFYGAYDPSRLNIAIKSPAGQAILFLILTEVIARYHGRSFIHEDLVPSVRRLVGNITGRF